MTQYFCRHQPPTPDRSPVHPREVFADGVADHASCIIVAHNYPAGSLQPSPGDADVTRQLKKPSCQPPPKDDCLRKP